MRRKHLSGDAVVCQSVRRLRVGWVVAPIVSAVIDDQLSPDFPFGDALEVCVRREDAERFIEEGCGDSSCAWNSRSLHISRFAIASRPSGRGGRGQWWGSRMRPRSASSSSR